MLKIIKKNANEKHNELSPLTCQNGYYQQIKKWWQEHGEKGTFVIVAGNVNWYSHSGKQYKISQNIKNITIIQSTSWKYNYHTIPLLGIYLRKIKTLIQKYISTPMFTAALVTIAKLWKQCKCPSSDDWIKKMWLCIYTYMCVWVHTYWNITQS